MDNYTRLNFDVVGLKNIVYVVNDGRHVLCKVNRRFSKVEDLENKRHTLTYMVLDSMDESLIGREFPGTQLVEVNCLWMKGDSEVMGEFFALLFDFWRRHPGTLVPPAVLPGPPPDSPPGPPPDLPPGPPPDLPPRPPPDSPRGPPPDSPRGPPPDSPHGPPPNSPPGPPRDSPPRPPPHSPPRPPPDSPHCPPPHSPPRPPPHSPRGPPPHSPPRPPPHSPPGPPPHSPRGSPPHSPPRPPPHSPPHSPPRPPPPNSPPGPPPPNSPPLLPPATPAATPNVTPALAMAQGNVGQQVAQGGGPVDLRRSRRSTVNPAPQYYHPPPARPHRARARVAAPALQVQQLVEPPPVQADIAVPAAAGNIPQADVLQVRTPVHSPEPQVEAPHTPAQSPVPQVVTPHTPPPPTSPRVSDTPRRSPRLTSQRSSQVPSPQPRSSQVPPPQPRSPQVPSPQPRSSQVPSPQPRPSQVPSPQPRSSQVPSPQPRSSTPQPSTSGLQAMRATPRKRKSTSSSENSSTSEVTLHKRATPDPRKRTSDSELLPQERAEGDQTARTISSISSDEVPHRRVSTPPTRRSPRLEGQDTTLERYGFKFYLESDPSYEFRPLDLVTVQTTSGEAKLGMVVTPKVSSFYPQPPAGHINLILTDRYEVVCVPVDRVEHLQYKYRVHPADVHNELRVRSELFVKGLDANLQMVPPELVEDALKFCDAIERKIQQAGQHLAMHKIRGALRVV